jgi:hypothetical protein
MARAWRRIGTCRPREACIRSTHPCRASIPSHAGAQQAPDRAKRRYRRARFEVIPERGGTFTTPSASLARRQAKRTCAIRARRAPGRAASAARGRPGRRRRCPGRSRGCLTRDLLDLADGDAHAVGVAPDAVLPGPVLLRVPVALVVELRAFDHLRTRGSGDLDLHAAVEAGAAAGHLALADAQLELVTRLGRGVAELRVDGLALLHGAVAVAGGQVLPVALTQRDETDVAALGGEVHPGIGERRVAGHALAVPVHLRDHALRGLVGEEAGAAEETHGVVVALLVVGLQPQQAVLHVLVVVEEAGGDQHRILGRVRRHHVLRGEGRCGEGREQGKRQQGGAEARSDVHGVRRENVGIAMSWMRTVADRSRSNG